MASAGVPDAEPPGSRSLTIDLTDESDDETPTVSSHAMPAAQPLIKSEPVEEQVELLDTSAGKMSERPAEGEAAHKSETDGDAAQPQPIHKTEQAASTHTELTNAKQPSQLDVLSGHPSGPEIVDVVEQNGADAEPASQPDEDHDDIMMAEQPFETEMSLINDHDLAPLEDNPLFMHVPADTAVAGPHGRDSHAFAHNDTAAAEQALQDDTPGLPDMDMNAVNALMLYNMNDDGIEEASVADDTEQPEQPEPIHPRCEIRQDVDMSDWNSALEVDAVLADQRNELHKAAFSRLKTEFLRRQEEGSLTQVDEINFAAAEAAERARLRDFERSKMAVEETPATTSNMRAGYEEQDSLFIPEVPELTVKQVKKRAVSKPKNRINAQELREAMSAGIDAGYASGRKGKRKAPTTGEDKQPRKKRERKAGAAKPGPKGRAKKAPNLSNIQSLGSTNVVQAANANESRPDMPTFTSKDKAKALKELIASIPNADQRSHDGERKAILEATKKFSGRGAVRSDGQGAWKLRGMESSLWHHQLLGAAFLRDRERSESKPHGGMVCDEMGFGKTIQMIANILDGKPGPDSPDQTTLIVAPPTLLSQWMSEMSKHVQGDALGRILRYSSGSRLVSNDVVSDLKRYDVILTTYGEVRASYPLTDPPKHLSSEAAKNEWWKNWYQTTCGPLHKVKFLRIVLDEAHAIKNHASKTSVAVRALTGTYRWAITGTPIMNYIEELYPYFSFLKVPHTGDYGTFLHNYCDNRAGKEPVNMARIHNILRAIMLRRTHVDSLFDAPIVKLPGISHTTHMVEFNSVERAIYSMVKRRYMYAINTFSSAGTLTQNYRSILAMLLRLRMLCSHIFLCQEMLKDMFVAADIENLWRLTAKEVETASEDAPRVNTLRALRKMLQSKDNTIQTSQTKTANPSGEPSPDTEPQDEDITTGKSFGLTFKFRKFLRSLTVSNTWTELHLRSMCGKCRLPPDEPMCTSCFHVYCKECLSAMDFERRERGEEKTACLECGAHFEETSSCSGLKELGFNSPDVARKVEKAKAKRSKKQPAMARRGSLTNSDGDEEEDPDPEDWIDMKGVVLPSAKLTATKAAILNWQAENPREKIIIYTQFLNLCKILGKMCETEGWGYVHFNGKMTLEARDKAIAKFRDDRRVSIMICSLKAGGIGLNLTMASKVIILDLWFNSAVEAQAYCRAFRIGQEKKVEVMRFVVKDSIDEDLVQMQDRKDGEITGAIGPDSLNKRATIQQLLELFGNVKEGEGQNEFILMEDEGQEGEDENVPMAERLPPRPF